jgi:GTP-binding protein YchF
MGLKCGIVGLPNVGKSTIFNALSAAKAEAANFPFCTIEPNIGVITIPDERLTKISELVKPERTVPNVMEFVDIAGLVKGASTGEGLGNQFLGNIRQVDAIVHVVRCFEDENIAHVDGGIDPVRDREIIDTELQLKDLETLEKRAFRLEKVAKSGDQEAKKQMALLMKVRQHLEEGKNVRTLQITPNEKALIYDLFLLTEKPVIYVANVSEDHIHEDNIHTTALKANIKDEVAELLKISGALESQIAELEDESEKELFLNEYGLEESGLNQLIRASYKLLNLITFFTAGPNEVRAWTLRKGWKAPQAAGVIHSDFERGFIRAEVIKYDDFINLGSEQACKERGKMSVEGKEYVMKDADLVYFRFNV